MEVDTEFEAKLIDIIRDYNILWDKRVDGYRRKKDKFWIEVSTKLDNPEFQASECQKLWEKLRNQFMAHQRKLRKPTGSGAGKRPYFRHEDAMRFIRDSEDNQTTYSNLEADADKDGLDEIERGAMENSPTSDTGENDADEPASGSTQIRGTKLRDEDHRVHEKHRGKRKLDSFDQTLINMLKSDEKDEFSCFGDLIGTKLRKLSEKDAKSAAEVQFSIGTMLHEAEMKLL